MADPKLRQAIAHEAARLMYERVESEYFTAKMKAAKRLCRDRCKPEDLPSNAEIRQLIQSHVFLHEGDKRNQNLKAMRLAGLAMMRQLRLFKPRLIGSVLTGHTRSGSDIDIHVFTDTLSSLTDMLDGESLQYDVESKLVRKYGETNTFVHVHVFDKFKYELTIYPEDQAHHVFRSSITGGPIERASVRELEMLIEREYPDVDLETLGDEADVDDPYPLFRLLLQPLDGVRQRPEYHPEGDVLYHSLQVFEQAKVRLPYDVEFLLAALLHDVGKGIEPHNHVEAAVRSLTGVVTDRTMFLIEHHLDAQEYREGTLSPRRRDKLRQSEDFDDLLLLAECDRAGRVPGAIVGTLDEALGYMRELERENDG
jgi:predicted nucleotidyltransferase